MKAEILKLLREADGFLSGQDICTALNVSRTAVWKIIRQLEEEGYRIKAVRNRGYCLLESADVVTKAELESTAATKWCGRRVEYYEETDSTNLRAKALAEQGLPHGTLVVAEYQSAGRGRRGREWTAEASSGCFMSLILRPGLAPSAAPMLTLMAALAVRSGVSRITEIDTKIKWPNDLVVGGRKICGILTEMSAELDVIHYVVTGIGINVNQASFPQELADKASSLYLCTGKMYRRSQIILSVMESYEHYYNLFMQTGNLSLVVEEYNSCLAGRGELILVVEPGQEYEAKELGIDQSGGLLVQLADGTVKQIISGEVSIRKPDGYI